MGVKVTVLMQFAPALSVAGEIGQVWVSAKSPLGMMPAIVRTSVPVFESVTVSSLLVVPSS